jgi:hypothetical protein
VGTCEAAEVIKAESDVGGSGWQCTGEGTVEVAGTLQTTEVV